MTVNIGVIGTGAIGVEHINRLVDKCPGAEVVAVSDIDGERAASVAQRIGAVSLGSGQEVIAASKVDAVLVASWGPTHEQYLLAAIEAGKSVFCEKPLATSAEACKRIVDAEIAHGSPLVQVGFMRRYDVGYRGMKQVLDSGEIGSALLAHCVHRNAGVPTNYESSMAIQDTAVHEIDILRWLLDDEIVSVQVLTPRRSALAPERLQDPIVLLMETEAGRRLDVEVFVNCQYGYDIQCELVGEKGTVRLPDPPAPTVRVSGRVVIPVLQDWKDRFIDAYDVEISEWVQSLEVGTLHGPTAWDGLAASVIADSAVRAQESGGILRTGLPPKPDFYSR